MTESDALDLAQSSPKSLLISSSFWVEHLQSFIIVVVSIIAFSYLFVLTYPKSEWFTHIFSIIIYGFALWGLRSAIIILTKIKVEYAFAFYVGKKAEDKLREIRNKKRDHFALTEVGDLLPDNPTPNLAMRRLFEHIIGEAKDLRFESSMTTMQPYREEALDDIFKLQNIQKIALQLGILGTFIGLILALSQLNLDAGTTLELKPLFDSLYISFSTSVAGLEVAVILGLLIMVIHLKQKAYFQTMEKAVDTMNSLARNATPDDCFFNHFAQIESQISRLQKNIYDQTQEVKKQTKNVEEQTEEMRRGIDKLTGTKAQFQEFLGQIQESQERFQIQIQESQKHFQIQIQDLQAHFVENMMVVYKTFSPETITLQLQQSLKNAVEQISKTFNENLEPSLDKITAMNQALHELHSVLQALEDKLKEQNQQLEKVNQELVLAKSTLYSSTQPLLTAQREFIDSAVTELEKGNQELAQSKTDFYGSLHPLITSQNNTFHDFQRDVKAMSERITSLNRELQKSNEVVQDLVKLISSRKPWYSIFEKLKKMFSRSSK